MDKPTFLPAEWYPQSGIQLTWPHAQTDWNYMLQEVEACYVDIAREIAARELLLIVTPEVEKVRRRIEDWVNMDRVRFCCCETNDTWARDHGGITMIRQGEPQICDFKFNGWGLKFAADHDNLVTSCLFEQHMLHATYDNRLNFVLEGGSIESDGKGTLLTTSECLLSKNRNGQWNRQQIESYLKECFHLQRVLWLDHGYLAGDDTDSHIDTLARLCPNDTIVYVRCEDVSDEHFETLSRMEQQLKSFCTIEGKPYRLLPLPMAQRVESQGERLPATYANFLIMNTAVLYPTYRQPHQDEEARRVLSIAFPDHDLVGIDCSALIKQHGSLHCVTMQYPEGIIK